MVAPPLRVLLAGSLLLLIVASAQGQNLPARLPRATAPRPRREDFSAGPGYAELVRRLEAAEAEIQQLRRAQPMAAVAQPFSPPEAAELTPPGLVLPELLNPANPEATERLEALRRLPDLEGRVEALEVAREKLPLVRLSGLFQADAFYFNQDADSFATLADPFPGVPGAQSGIAEGDLQNGADFRRARLMAIGQVAENVNYVLEMDFAAPGRPSFMDLWGEVTDLPRVGNVRIGQFRQPFSMTAMTSIRTLPFLERPLPFAFVPFRRLGVMAYDQSEDLRSTWAYSVSRANADPYGGDLGDQNGYAFFTRATRLLYYDEPAEGRYLVHVGGNYAFVAPTENRYRFATIPELGAQQASPPGVVSNSLPLFVDTGLLSLDHFHLMGAELAASYGSFWAQAEYLHVLADQTAASAVGFDGVYLESGYFLTGESRPYNRAAGVFGRVIPYENFFAVDRGICGIGAWEVAARYSYLDLTDENVLGGTIQDFTAGLNWYWNPYTKLQFNYIHAFLENPFHGASDTDLFAARFHLDF